MVKWNLIFIEDHFIALRLSLNGFEVVGVESEEDKCVQFFNEHKIDYLTSQKKKFKLFKVDLFKKKI